MTSSNSGVDHSPQTDQPASASFALWPLPELTGGAAALLPSHIATPEDEAFERGYAEGARAAGLETERETLALLDAVRGALETGAAEREAERQVVEENVYAIAVAVARQVLHAAIREDGEVIRGIVRRAVDMAGPTGILEITMHPDDRAVVAESLEIQTESGVSRKVNWHDDPAAPKGSCIVECEQRLVRGGVDAALFNLFERLAHA